MSYCKHFSLVRGRQSCQDLLPTILELNTGSTSSINHNFWVCLNTTSHNINIPSPYLTGHGRWLIGGKMIGGVFFSTVVGSLPYNWKHFESSVVVINKIELNWKWNYCHACSCCKKTNKQIEVTKLMPFQNTAKVNKQFGKC